MLAPGRRSIATDHVHSVLVPDTEIVHARQALWGHRRIAAEYGPATALAALLTPGQYVADGGLSARPKKPSTSYRPAGGEKVCVVLCDANTDTRTFMHP
ncbi:hypothetical protein [Streptomyces lavendofoliae]|uniref:hypothetical protein n=1 Tax=Streptomyces lavendofoliae TaxID=67314 RepID=UPI003D93E613